MADDELPHSYQPELVHPDFQVVQAVRRVAFRGRVAFSDSPAGPPDFSSVVERFRKFRTTRFIAKDPNCAWIAEAEKRLDQMAMLIKRVDVLQRRDRRIDRRRVWPAPNATNTKIEAVRNRLADEIELATESFYYFGFRFQDILKTILKISYEPKGIRQVRHDLIEHAQRAGADDQTFVYGLDMNWGPVIKPFGERRNDVQDAGLYVNAVEAIRDLERALTAVEQKDSMNPSSIVD